MVVSPYASTSRNYSSLEVIERVKIQLRSTWQDLVSIDAYTFHPFVSGGSSPETVTRTESVDGACAVWAKLDYAYRRISSFCGIIGEHLKPDSVPNDVNPNWHLAQICIEEWFSWFFEIPNEERIQKRVGQMLAGLVATADSARTDGIAAKAHEFLECLRTSEIEASDDTGAVPILNLLDEIVDFLAQYAPQGNADARIGNPLELAGTPRGDQLDERKIVPPATKSAVTCEQARAEMLRMREEGERFTSQFDMARRIGCSSSTINKAISRESELKEWSDKPRSSSTGMKRLNGLVTDNTPQTTEIDPSDMLDSGDVDAAMQYLMSQASTEERARIDAMDPVERRQLAEIAFCDPDTTQHLTRSRSRTHDD